MKDLKAKEITPSVGDRVYAGVPENIQTADVGTQMPLALEKFRRCRHCSTRQNNKRSKVQCSSV